MIVISLIVLIVTILTGVLVFVIVRHTHMLEQGEQSLSDLSSSITGIKSNILSDEAANTTQIASSAAALKSLTTNLGTSVLSNRLAVTTPTSVSAGDSLSLSTTFPTANSGSTNVPNDSTKYISVTDKNSSIYQSMALSSMFADKGIALGKGACVDFGGNGSMCGNTSGFVTNNSASSTGIQMSLQGALNANTKNSFAGAATATPLQTSFPGDTASGGMNRIVGDTLLTADVVAGGNVVGGNTQAVGVGMISNGAASHIYTGVPVATAKGITATVPKLTMGFGIPSATSTGVPVSGNDVMVMTKTATGTGAAGNNVQINGSLTICDEAGGNCFTVTGVKSTGSGIAIATPAIADWTK